MSSNQPVQALGARAGLQAGRAKRLFRHPFRRKNLRLRVLAPATLAVVAVATADASRATAVLGLPLIVGGTALRTWATGHLVKTAEFTVSGPYAYLRHPLYAGTLLIIAGFLLLAGSRLAMGLLAGFLVFFFGFYVPRKERVETERLEALYGERFRAYRAAVRPLWPRWRAWLATHRGAETNAGPRWRFERYRDNDELGTVLVVAAALILVLLQELA